MTIIRQPLLRQIAALSALICFAGSTQALEQTSASVMETCLLEGITTAEADTTAAEIRTACEADIAVATNTPIGEPDDSYLTPLQARAAAEEMNYDRLFAITAFKTNYFTASYMTDPNQAAINTQRDLLNNEEAKFQISIKAPIWRDMFGSKNDLMVAYTSLSWWQIGNNTISAAFRETNYEPELFMRHRGGPKFLGGEIAAFDIGLNHQSNGRSGSLSRSWNRVMGRAFFDFNSVAIELRAWYRIPEDADDDDNPFMYRYYGYGDIRVAYAPNRNTFTAMLRPGTQESGLELTWSYGLTNSLRLYAQYWNGYGESLLDYDARIERVGIGIAINDYIQRR